MVRRNGLLLDSTGAVGAALHALQLSAWDFQVAVTLDDARKILSICPASVGLVAFDEAHPWPPQGIESLLTCHDIEWIAVFGGHPRGSRMLAPLVLKSFHDFHTLPLDRERLAITLGHAHGKALACRRENACEQNGACYGMDGRSPEMLRLFRQIERIVAVDAPVLIGGESGTGKDLVARAIHAHSARARAPFIAMNCGAIAPNLIHSELFGYERGAFTGASQRKIGNIEAANNGVLFLDEIGDLPLDLQASLLRFLQEKTIVRVGATEHLRMNVRVIAATHVDLDRAVTEGRFREDLYYRLNVLHLKVPPLRERKGDIPLLAQAVFASNLAQKSPQLKGFSSEALRAMAAYDWPGNVRELINRVQHAMIMSENRLASAADLGLADGINGAAAPTLDEARALAEREIIEHSLQKYQNNVSETARQLGVSRVTLYRMIDRLKIVL